MSNPIAAPVGATLAVLNLSPHSQGILGVENLADSGVDGTRLHGHTTTLLCVSRVLAQNGLHVNEDHFLVEVIDPSNETPVAVGERGELVFTTLTREAMPLLRYRTGDVATLDRSPCVCGRTLVRMSRVLGRVDDMLVIRGVNVYPNEVEAVLLADPAVRSQYLLVVDQTGTMPNLVVACELAGAAGGDDER